MPYRFLAPFLCLALWSCDEARSLVDTEALEAELKHDPGRPGKVGAVVGVAVHQRAASFANAVRSAPDASCLLPVTPGHRWIGELTLERRRASAIVSRWNETRTLDYDTTGSVSVRSAASYKTEIDTEGARNAEWRVIGGDAWIATGGSQGDLWSKRTAEEDEVARILTVSEGTIQALIDAVDGWQRSPNGWVAGTERLRCVEYAAAQQFIARFDPGSSVSTATLRLDGNHRQLDAVWVLSDGSQLHATFEDHTVPLSDRVHPPDGPLVPIERDRSLWRAEELLTKLAAQGAADIASTIPAESGEP